MNNDSTKINGKHARYIINYFLFLLFILSPIKAQSNNGLKLYNYSNKTEFTYIKKPVNVTYNDKKISNDKIPGVIIDNVAMVPFNDVFTKSSIKADWSYDSKKGQITLSKNKNTIILTVGSKTAVLNGKKVNMPIAPMKIKYVKENIIRNLVPASFVSEALGLKYVWNNASVTSQITSLTDETINNSSVESGMRLYDYASKKSFIYSKKPVSVSFDDEIISSTNAPGIIIDNIAMVPFNDIYVKSSIKADWQYDSAKGEIILGKNDNTIILTIGSDSAVLNGKKVKLPKAPIKVKYANSGLIRTLVPATFVSESLGYSYTWNNSSVTSQIKTVTNNDLPPELSGEANELQYKESLYVLNSAIDKSLDKKNRKLGYITNIDYNLIDTNIEEFAFTSMDKFGIINTDYTDNTLIIKAINMSFDLENYKAIITNSKYINDIEIINSDKQECIIKLLLKDRYKYDITISEDRLNMKVLISENELQQIDIGTYIYGDYINLVGIKSENLIINKDDKNLYIDILNTIINFEDLNKDINQSKMISNVNLASSSKSLSSFITNIKEEFEYYFFEDEAGITIIIEKKKNNNNNITPSPGNTMLKIPLPEGINLNKIEDSDLYLNNKFIIKIPGDHLSFYTKNPIKNNIKDMNSIEVLYSSKSTQIVFNTKKILAYKYFINNGYIYIEIGNPNKIHKNIVVLDPGHGGKDPGAVYNKVNEKDIAYKILYTYASKLFDSKSSNIKAYYTRIDDSYPTLYERADFAKEIGADIFVSLHMNAATNTSASGTETYYSASNNLTNKSGLNSLLLANMFTKNISKKFNLQNRGAKAQKYVVVHKNTVPAVLVELAFMSNANDFKFMTNENNQKLVAAEIYNTLNEVFDKYPTNR